MPAFIQRFAIIMKTIKPPPISNSGMNEAAVADVIPGIPVVG
jgi:hypothetical protein